MAELWTPQNGDGPQAPNIIVAGAKIRHRCVCGAVFYATDDPHSDDLRFLRHERKCSDSEEFAEEAVHRRETEPLRQRDDEWDDWRLAKAEERRDPTVKGTTAWVEHERRKQRKRRRR